MNYSLVKVEDAKTEPISVAEAKVHLREDATELDDYISGLITAARVAIEQSIARPIGEQTYELGLRNWPAVLGFPNPPLIDVKSIKYTLSTGETKTLFDKTASPVVNCDTFTVDTSAEPGELWQKSAAWPSDELQHGFPIRIRFTAGMVTVPKPLIQAMLLLIGQWYQNRENVTETPLTEMPNAVKWLCNQYAFEEFK